MLRLYRHSMISKSYMNILSVLLVLILFWKMINYDQNYRVFIVIFFEALYIKTITSFRCCGMRNNPGLDIVPQT